MEGVDPGELAPGSDDGCTVLHVDMDAFFASVEIRRRPQLRGLPVVVGWAGPRGVVTSASYEARRFGVRSAMPCSQARRLCPQAVFVAPDPAAYGEASRAVMAIFAEVTPLVEQLSVDEAFLDVAGARKLFGSPAQIGRNIKARVLAEQQLSCSVGAAATKFMAKLASTRSKPDGLLVVPVDRALDFLHPLPIEALWGVGARTGETLRRLGLRTVGELAEAPTAMLRRAVGEAAAAQLHELAWARDPRPVSPQRVERSTGAETTFDVDVDDPDVIRRTLLALSTKVGARLRAAGHAGRTVAIKVRLEDFRTLSRSRTLGVPTDVAREIFDTAWQLFQALNPRDRVRLVGVRVEGLDADDSAGRQLALGEREHGWRDAERATDAAAARFGGGAVGPASLLRRESDRVAGRDPARKLRRGSRPPPGPAGSDNSPGRTDPGGPVATEVAERDFDPLSDPLRPS